MSRIFQTNNQRREVIKKSAGMSRVSKALPPIPPESIVSVVDAPDVYRSNGTRRRLLPPCGRPRPVDSFYSDALMAVVLREKVNKGKTHIEGELYDPTNKPTPESGDTSTTLTEGNAPGRRSHFSISSTSSIYGSENSSPPLSPVPSIHPPAHPRPHPHPQPQHASSSSSSTPKKSNPLTTESHTRRSQNAHRKRECYVLGEPAHALAPAPARGYSRFFCGLNCMRGGTLTYFEVVDPQPVRMSTVVRPMSAGGEVPEVVRLG